MRAVDVLQSLLEVHGERIAFIGDAQGGQLPLILAALDQLAVDAGSDTTAVFYFSGHGYAVDLGISKRYYLMPYGYDVTIWIPRPSATRSWSSRSRS